MIRRVCQILALVFIAMELHCTASAADPTVVEEQTALPVTIAGHAEQLETLIVRPVTGTRLPIALIVNGSSKEPRSLHAEGLAHLAHDFAHRGWLAAAIAWRGYGGSSGTVQNEAGTCIRPEVARFLDAHADDLEAALISLRTRPDVDRNVALGLGVSIGGVSMLDLAARPDRPLTAVVNVSGGLYHDARQFEQNPACGPFEADLAGEVSSFGAARVPTLWLYAENDPWFRPELVGRMLDGYRGSGGKADFTMFPPIGTDGHTLFKWAANDLTEPKIEDFLRANALPAMEGTEAFGSLMSTLAARDRSSVEDYLRAPTEKALALPSDGNGAYWNFASRSIEDARQQALAHCRTASGKPCRIVAENRNLLPTWRDALAGYSDR
ncbi:hypothetical protein GCM10011611_02860 [Aliidongia dinghuensis]|uniref:Xaa-Pro dipeptidyl-peptidase-like domain-containing protein n=1 Tax=Aliidongia dinghuensis TaxID=1867774 RepID=A0A8J3E2R3_9PROT|nr:CocE/NonD family hydrolase [Aliidongia dinghuensis]GGF00697.1 hypothetical protein GCM10011611_02860 [Aliidongia dinghuensis]